MEEFTFDYEGTKAWYIVHTKSRQEELVKERLEKRRESMGIEDQLLKVVIPYDVSIEIKKGKPVEVKKKLYPGYVFVEMYMTDYAWYVVRNTKDVSGFIGSSGGGAKPTPVSDDDVLKVLRKSGETLVEVSDFSVGDNVIVLDGAFEGTKSKIDFIDENNKVAYLTITMFDRQTKIEVELSSLQKIEEVDNVQ